MSADKEPVEDTEHQRHHRSLVELFEALLAHAERRFGMSAHQAVDLLRSVEESEHLRREMLRGIWTAVVALLIAGIAGVLLLGVKVWVGQ